MEREKVMISEINLCGYTALLHTKSQWFTCVRVCVHVRCIDIIQYTSMLGGYTCTHENFQVQKGILFLGRPFLSCRWKIFDFYTFSQHLLSYYEYEKIFSPWEFLCTYFVASPDIHKKCKMNEYLKFLHCKWVSNFNI